MLPSLGLGSTARSSPCTHTHTHHPCSVNGGLMRYLGCWKSLMATPPPPHSPVLHAPAGAACRVMFVRGRTLTAPGRSHSGDTDLQTHRTCVWQTHCHSGPHGVGDLLVMSTKPPCVDARPGCNQSNLTHRNLQYTNMQHTQQATHPTHNTSHTSNTYPTRNNTSIQTHPRPSWM